MFLHPNEILNILDMARDTGIVPCFSGDSGLGKSYQAKKWVKKQQEQDPNFIFADFRITYMERPDIRGKSVVFKDPQGNMITKDAMPSIFPQGEDARGLLLFEEPNRGDATAMNVLFQILTDRKVHEYGLPKGIVMAAIINPDTLNYMVQTMDVALKSRFLTFDITYDHAGFMQHATESNWDKILLAYLKDWVYKTPLDSEAYISPREWERVDVLLKYYDSNYENDLLIKCLYAALGRTLAPEFIAFLKNNKPVRLNELLNNTREALRKLEEISNSDTYRGDLISITCDEVLENIEKVNNDLFISIIKVLPNDHARRLFVDGYSTKNYLDSWCQNEEKRVEYEKNIQSLVESDPELKAKIYILKNDNSNVTLLKDHTDKVVGL